MSKKQYLPFIPPVYHFLLKIITHMYTLLFPLLNAFVFLEAE